MPEFRQSKATENLCVGKASCVSERVPCSHLLVLIQVQYMFMTLCAQRSDGFTEDRHRQCVFRMA